MPAKVKPLSAYPVRETKRIWKIAPYDPAVAYSVRMASPTLLTVLANGSREVFRKRVERDLPGQFRVKGRTLIYEVYPRELERARRAHVEAERMRAERAREEATARGNPAYRAFVRRLTKELGKPRAARACDRKQLAFRAPSDERCAELIQEARRSAASATLYLARWGRELRVIAGRVGPLAALFEWNLYGPGALEPALDALDRDAGLTIDYIGWAADTFSFSLDRRPRRERLAAVNDVFFINRAGLARQQRARRFAVGDPADSAPITRVIVDPGTEDEGEED